MSTTTIALAGKIVSANQKNGRCHVNVKIEDVAQKSQGVITCEVDQTAIGASYHAGGALLVDGPALEADSSAGLERRFPE